MVTEHIPAFGSSINAPSDSASTWYVLMTTSAAPTELKDLRGR